MSASAPSHAHRLLTHRKMDPSPANVAYAERRVRAAGRLAELGAHLVPGLLRVRTVEHGDADMMAPGSVLAECWLDARDLADWQARASQLMMLEELAAKQHGLRLMLAIRRASWLDRLRERAAWWWSR